VDVAPEGDRALTRGRVVAAAVAGWAVLLLLGAGVLTGFGPQGRLDRAASQLFYVGDHPPRWLHLLLSAVTAPGLSIGRAVIFLPIVVWLLIRRAWWPLIWVVVTTVTIAPLTSLLKAFFDRVRPQFQNGGARLTSLSFPSGHSSGIAATVVVLLLLARPLLTTAARRWSVAAGVVAVVVVGLGRMWQGVHYLTDVLGGWSLGVAWSLTLALAFDALSGGRAGLRPRPAVRAGGSA
jgi:membrane-associated phospholipid phosphatase